jgi:hypothetical protein
MCMARADKLRCPTLTMTPVPPVPEQFAGPLADERERLLMCHFNNLLLNFICAYTTSGLPGIGLASSTDACNRVAMFADVRELGFNAQGMITDALKFTTDAAKMATRLSQVGSTWRSYFTIPGLMAEMFGKVASLVINIPESAWPLIAGSSDISTARTSYEQIRKELDRAGWYELSHMFFRWENLL